MSFWNKSRNFCFNKLLISYELNFYLSKDFSSCFAEVASYNTDTNVTKKVSENSLFIFQWWKNKPLTFGSIVKKNFFKTILLHLDCCGIVLVSQNFHKRKKQSYKFSFIAITELIGQRKKNYLLIEHLTHDAEIDGAEMELHWSLRFSILLSVPFFSMVK